MFPMQYKIVAVKAKVTGLVRVDLEKFTADLVAQVNDQIAQGWEPLGGVTYTPLASGGSHLLQAMVKRG